MTRTDRPRIVVIGGGITGQLFQLQVPEAEIYDWKSAVRTIRPLTRNFGGNYLWKPIPGVECRSFPVVTHIDGHPATEDSIRAYKKKIGKAYEEEMPNNWAQQFQTEMTGWDFIQLPEPRVNFDHRIVEIDIVHQTVRFVGRPAVSYDVLISTIPLYAFLNQIGWTTTGPLKYSPIYVRVITNVPDRRFGKEVFYVNYLSDPSIMIYRTSDRDDERHYESLQPLTGHFTTKIVPGKIHPHNEVKQILRNLTKNNIYTFGRYGSWQPDELVHETWDRITEWREQHVGR